MWKSLFLGLVLLAVCFVAWLVTWPRVEMLDPEIASAAEGPNPECPHTPMFRPKLRGFPVDSQVPLSGPITGIPEFHDCQRFIVRVGRDEVYDSLYAIYASFELRILEHRIDSLQDSSSFPQYYGAIAAVPAATVYSYEGTYDSLRIKPGYNCLYLWHHEADWRAWMIPKGPNDPECPDPLVIDASLASQVLQVDRQALPGFGEQDYPPVARWDWDGGQEEQYIGIMCGAAWCDVSDDGAATAPPDLPVPRFEHPSTVPEENRRVGAIKGWRDAQRLATSHNGSIVPSSVWGVVTPHPTLGTASKNGAFQDKWFHAATAVVSADYTGSVLTLHQGRPYRIFLCYGSADACEIPIAEKCEGDRSVPRWWGQGRFRTAYYRPVIQYRCVANVDHSSNVPEPIPTIPGTARWRWLTRDETTWKRCDEGCCKLL